MASAEQGSGPSQGRPGLGIRVIGHLSVPGDNGDTVSRPLVVTLDEIHAVFHTRVVDEVAVCLSPTAAHHADLDQPLDSDEDKTVLSYLSSGIRRNPARPDGGPAANQEAGGVRPVRSVDGPRSRAHSPLLLGTAVVFRLREGSYIDRCWLALDLKILVRTIPAVFVGTGS